MTYAKILSERKNNMCKLSKRSIFNNGLKDLSDCDPADTLKEMFHQYKYETFLYNRSHRVSPMNYNLSWPLSTLKAYSLGQDKCDVYGDGASNGHLYIQCREKYLYDNSIIY